MNLFYKKDKAKLARNFQLETLKMELEQAQKALKLAEESFDMVEGDDLCDALIYERAAASARYAHLIKEIKMLSAEMARENK